MHFYFDPLQKPKRKEKHFYTGLRSGYTMGVIPISLPALLMEPVLRKEAVDRGLRLSTKQ